MCGVTKKSGKHSCCAPGGSWFQNCGDFGDSKFDHTWFEGIQACKGSVKVSVKSAFQVVLRQAGAIAHPQNTVQPSNATQHRIDIDHSRYTTNDGSSNSGKCSGLMEYAVFIYTATMLFVHPYDCIISRRWFSRYFNSCRCESHCWHVFKIGCVIISRMQSKVVKLT